MQMKNCFKSGISGFTIYELLIVILVIGILAGLILTRMNSESGLAAALAADQAASDIRSVQHNAMYSGTSRSIIFNGNNYTAQGLMPENRVLPGNAVVNTPYTITFNSFGEPDQGGSLIISCGGDSKTLTIEALTGKVSIN